MDFLVDNDILIDLATCDLLEEFPPAFGASRHQIQILPSARYVMGILGKRRLAPAPHGEETRNRLKSFLMGIQDITNSDDKALSQLIQKCFGIDEGEANLMTAICSNEFLIATGDKKSLSGLANCEVGAEVFQRIKGHVVCLEQIILRIIDHVGFARVAAKMASNPIRDRGSRSQG